MFNIQELDDLICQYLNQHDLTQCAQVNKKWHAIAIPHIRHTLQWPHPFDTQKGLRFRSMVLEDYLEAHALENEGHSIGQHIHSRPYHMSTLSKYAPLIQEFPSLERLCQILRPPTQDKQDSSQGVGGQTEEPTEYQLLTHILSNCRPDVQFASVYVDTKKFLLDGPETAAKAFAIPRSQRVRFSGTFETKQTEFARVKDLFSRCSTVLESLELGLNFNEA
ncbi:hypothetical protein BGX31_004772, partial [Mortierella sp. GBA43]